MTAPSRTFAKELSEDELDHEIGEIITEMTIDRGKVYTMLALEMAKFELVRPLVMDELRPQLATVVANMVACAVAAYTVTSKIPKDELMRDVEKIVMRLTKFVAYTEVH